jgi:NADH-quinone oxidoreductase subunit N
LLFRKYAHATMVNLFHNFTTLFGSIPLLVLSFLIVIQILLNLNISQLKFLKINSPYALPMECGLILTAVFLLQIYEEYEITYQTVFLSLPTAKYLKIIILGFSLLALPSIAKSLLLQKINSFEYYTFFLILILTSLLLTSSYNYLHIYLLLEIQALCFYILIMINRESPFAVEAGVYYFFVNALISCLFIFSLVIIYSCYGTLNMFEIEAIFAHKLPVENPSYLSFIKAGDVGIISLTLAILAKIGAFPYHFWVPKVYEGAPLGTTIILSYLPKLVLFNLLIKMCQSFSYLEFHRFWPLFLFMGLGSIFVGSLFACFQTRLKRVLIYSSISQMGFPVLMFCFWDVTPAIIYRTIYMFLFIYLISSILSWSYYVLIYQHFNTYKNVDTDEKLLTPIYLADLKDIYYDEKGFSFFSSIAFFSMAGMPPFAGFVSKVLVTNELFNYNVYAIILIILFLSSLSTFYYLQLIKIIFFEEASEKKSFFFLNFTNEFLFDSLYRFCTYSFIICLLFSFSLFFFLDFWIDYIDLILLSSHSYRV